MPEVPKPQNGEQSEGKDEQAKGQSPEPVNPKADAEPRHVLEAERLKRQDGTT